MKGRTALVTLAALVVALAGFNAEAARTRGACAMFEDRGFPYRAEDAKNHVIVKSCVFQYFGNHFRVAGMTQAMGGVEDCGYVKCYTSMSDPRPVELEVKIVYLPAGSSTPHTLMYCTAARDGKGWQAHFPMTCSKALTAGFVQPPTLICVVRAFTPNAAAFFASAACSSTPFPRTDARSP